MTSKKKLAGTTGVFGTSLPSGVSSDGQSFFFISSKYQQKLFGHERPNIMAIVLLLKNTDLCEIEPNAKENLPSLMTHDQMLQMWRKLKSEDIQLRHAWLIGGEATAIELIDTNGCDIDALRV